MVLTHHERQSVRRPLFDDLLAHLGGGNRNPRQGLPLASSIGLPYLSA